ncbi:MAG: hypothetical protein MI717_07140 [Spirochaetales bacterium]|nr:hypothetical protein [Spirochaetales bacterium]
MITGQIVVFHTRPSEDITQNSPVRTRLIGAASGKMNRNVANRFSNSSMYRHTKSNQQEIGIYKEFKAHVVEHPNTWAITAINGKEQDAVPGFRDPKST